MEKEVPDVIYTVPGEWRHEIKLGKHVLMVFCSSHGTSCRTLSSLLAQSGNGGKRTHPEHGKRP